MQANLNCIIWSGAKNKAGYPITWFNNKWAYAHRVVAGAKKGEIVRHTCDNPSCVNPNHLIIGTHSENSRDMVNRNRQAKGESAGASRFTKEVVLQIRALQGSFSSHKLSKMFGMSKTNVLDIWKRKIWKHL